MTKRTHLPFNERHHPDRSDPSQSGQPREMSQYPSPLSLSSNCRLDGHSTLTILQYTTTDMVQPPPNVGRVPMERRHSILDSSYPGSFLSDDKTLVRLPLVSSGVLLSCIRRFRETI